MYTSIINFIKRCLRCSPRQESTSVNPDPKAYILSEAESLRILEEQILPAELGHLISGQDDIIASRRRQPLAVLVLGQTGAGKTRTAPVLKSAMTLVRGHEPAHFIADTYKTYHPQYSHLVASQPALASPATGIDARRWLAKAAEYAIVRRIDVLLESACRHPSDFSDLAQMFHDGGYRVEVAVLAVPEGLSILGILTRFYDRLPEAGSKGLPVRLTPRKVHDDSYRGLLLAADFIDSSDAVDQVVVLRRGNLVAYGDERVHGERMVARRWKEGVGGVQEAIRRERLRPLSESEKEAVEGELQKLLSRKNSALEKQVIEIREILESILDVPQDGFQFQPLTPLQMPTGSVFAKGCQLNLGMDAADADQR